MKHTKDLLRYLASIALATASLAACTKSGGGDDDAEEASGEPDGVIGVDGGSAGGSSTGGGSSGGGSTGGIIPKRKSGTAGGATSSNAAPILTTSSPQMLVAFGVAGHVVSPAMIEVADSDGDPITFTLESTPARGTLRKAGVGLAIGDTFTPADLAASRLTYDHGGTGSGLDDAFTFAFADPSGAGGDGRTFTFDVNETPTFLRPGPLYYDDGAAGMTLPADYLTATDADGDTITFTVTTAPAGTLRNGGVVLTVGDTFTWAQLLASEITYDHVGGSGDDGLDLRLSDGRGGVGAPTPIAIVVAGVDPVISLGVSPLVYAMGRSAALVAPSATLTDIDSPTFAGGRLRVAITAGDAAGDLLSLVTEGAGAGQIGISGAVASYEGTAIGAIAMASDSQSFDVHLNASATPAAAQALVRRVVFAHLDAEATALADRTITVTMLDGAGGFAETATTVDVRGLRAWWTLDDAPLSTSAHDSVAMSANAPLTGHAAPENDLDPATAWTTAGRIDGALAFKRAEREHIDTGFSLKATPTFTISTWVQIGAASGGQIFLWQGAAGANGWGATQNEFHVELNKYTDGTNDGRVGFFYGDNEGKGIVLERNMTLTVGDWLHVVVVVAYDAALGKAVGSGYVNGVAMVVDTQVVNASAEAKDIDGQNDRSTWRDSLRFGGVHVLSLAAPNTRFFEGLLDDVRAYDYAFTQAEAQALFDAAP